MLLSVLLQATAAAVGVSKLGAAIGAGLAVIGAGLGIGKIGGSGPVVLDVCRIRGCVRDISEIRFPHHHQDGGRP